MSYKTVYKTTYYIFFAALYRLRTQLLVRNMFSAVIHRSMIRLNLTRLSYHRSASTVVKEGPDYNSATDDKRFKHLVSDSEIRNSLLSGLLGERIISSTILSGALDPVGHDSEYTELVEYMKSPKAENVCDLIRNKKLKFKLFNEESNGSPRLLKKHFEDAFLFVHEYLKGLSIEKGRGTVLDLICETEKEKINVEIQVRPQAYWDIRFLSHICGLYYLQFQRGFKWASLEKDGAEAKKIKRVVGVCILVNVPLTFDNVRKYVPWFQSKAWDPHELFRHFRLANTSNPEHSKPGIEIVEYNLKALETTTPAEVLELLKRRRAGQSGEFTEQEVTTLREWLELLARGHTMTREAVEERVVDNAVKKAYKELERVDNEDDYDIPVVVALQRATEEGRAEGKMEGKMEVASKVVGAMLKLGHPLEDIAKLLDLTVEEVVHLSVEAPKDEAPKDET